ncbi:RidA family protein [Rahnella sp. PD12R]|uniref:RidA family protein n=1 Tax=Rahnella sp. PD12R TaxID=2855688 RepID=UPI001C44946F|nr:RidA family protein [Rahnella sp. PD12R]MBV6817026.1 RidA family protein [Rahnella sp. PD12R]
MLTGTLPFPKVRKSGDLYFVSGEVPITAEGTTPAGIEAQTHLVFSKIAGSLKEYNLTLDDAVSVNVYLTDKKDFKAFNEAYVKHFNAPYPARTTVCVELLVDVLLEINLIASAVK